jgi:uncharacterized damage-inducible protein DinB
MRKNIIAGFEKHVFNESYQRIFDCLDLLSENEVWHKPNDASNSVGVLIVHLIGNAQQWVVSSLGGIQDNRNRAAEFTLNGEFKKLELLAALAELKQRLELTLEGLTDEKLISKYEVQCYQETGFAILVHVIEHFSYHTGQIALLTKLIKDQDLGFYNHLDLGKTH